LTAIFKIAVATVTNLLIEQISDETPSFDQIFEASKRLTPEQLLKIKGRILMTAILDRSEEEQSFLNVFAILMKLQPEKPKVGAAGPLVINVASDDNAILFINKYSDFQNLSGNDGIQCRRLEHSAYDNEPGVYDERVYASLLKKHRQVEVPCHCNPWSSFHNRLGKNTASNLHGGYVCPIHVQGQGSPRFCMQHCLHDKPRCLQNYRLRCSVSPCNDLR
jgi:hypothetical protein